MLHCAGRARWRERDIYPPRFQEVTKWSMCLTLAALQAANLRIPTFPNPKPRSDPAPSPPDEGVDPFGTPGKIPSAEPDQPTPVLLVPSLNPQPSVADSAQACNECPVSAPPRGPSCPPLAPPEPKPATSLTPAPAATGLPRRPRQPRHCPAWWRTCARHRRGRKLAAR